MNFLCIHFTDGDDMIFIMDDHDNFPNWMMILNDMWGLPLLLSVICCFQKVDK